MRSENARYDVVITIGKYVGARVNRSPLPYCIAVKLANTIPQRGRPEIRLNMDATIETIENPGKRMTVKELLEKRRPFSVPLVPDETMGQSSQNDNTAVLYGGKLYVSPMTHDLLLDPEQAGKVAELVNVIDIDTQGMSALCRWRNADAR